MDVMPLVPETKMADARKQSVSGNHWPGEPRGQCLKLRPLFHFRPAFLEPTPGQEFSINTLIFQHSLSLSLSFHIFTYRANRLSPVWLPERTLSLSHFNSSQPLQKCICDSTILLLVTPFRWDFFQLQKQQKFRQTPERNKQTTWEKTCSS